MIRRSHNSGNGSKAKARLERIRDKALKLRERVKRSTALFFERRQARLSWWQRAFRTPLVGFYGWVKSRCSSMWAAMMVILGLSSKSRILPRATSVKRQAKGKRQSVIRGALHAEGLEDRKLLAAGSLQSFFLLSGSDTGYSSSDNITNDPTPTFRATWSGASGSNLSTDDIHYDTNLGSWAGNFLPSGNIQSSSGSVDNTLLSGLGTGSVATANVSAEYYDHYDEGSWLSPGYTGPINSLNRSVTIDLRAPTTNSVSVSDYSLAAGQASNLTYFFSEDVYDLIASDFAVSNGSVGTSLSSSTIASNRSVVFVPASNFEGSGSISLSGGSVRDRAGNSGQGSATVNFQIDTKLPVVTPGQVFSIDEGASAFPAAAIVAASDGNALSGFAIVSGNNNVDGDGTLPFAINSSTGEITVTDPGDLDVENGGGSFTLGVRVFDSFGNQSTPQSVTINVNNLATSIVPGQSASISESLAVGQNVLTVATTGDPAVGFSIVGGDPSGDFSISSTGVVSVAKDLDYETVSQYTLTIEVTDGTAPSQEQVTINLLDATEVVEVPSSAFPLDGHVTILKIAGKIHIQDDNQSDLVAPHDATKVSAIVVTGRANENDELTVVVDDLPAGVPVSYEGGAGGFDTLVLNGSTAATNITHTFYNDNNGKVEVDGKTINYTGLEPIIDNLPAANRTFNYAGGAETITLDNSGSLELKIDSTLGESVEFNAPTVSLTINAGSGDDVVIVNDIQAVQDATPFDLIVNGDAGNDEYQLDTATIHGLNSAAGFAWLPSGEKLSGYGRVAAKFSGAAGSTIQASGTAGGTLILGDASDDYGFTTYGDVIVWSGYTLQLDDALNAQIGQSTTIDGLLTTGTGTGIASTNSGSTVSGSGSIDVTLLLSQSTVAGALTVAGLVGDGAVPGNGSVSPGFSPGVINAGDLALNSGDTLSIEIDGGAGAGNVGGHDQINVAASFGGAGTVSLGGATLSLSSAAALLPQFGSYTIIDNDGGDAVSGTFAGLPEGAPISVGGRSFRITYAGGDGNDVVLYNQAEIEFDDGNTARAEDATSGPVVPTLVVRGDLTGVPVSQRTVSFTSPVGSATLGTDFSFTGSFVIPAANYATVTAFDLVAEGVLTINSDTLIEPAEVLTFGIGTGTGVGLKYGPGVDVDGDLSQRQAVNHTIIDSDAAEIEILGTIVSEEGGAQTVTVRLNATPGSTLQNAVSAQVNDLLTGTATSGTDYTAVGTPTVGFAAGSADGATTTFSFTPTSDTSLETTETVLLNLSNAAGPASLNPGTATISITDNEVGSLSIAGTTNGIESDTTLTNGKFTVTLDKVNDTGSPVVVNYTVSGNASGGGVDYNIPGSVTIANGSSVATIDVSVINDALLEPTETVIVTLAAPASTGSVTVGSPAAATISITDDEPVQATITAAASAAAEPGTDSSFTIALNNVNKTGGDIYVSYSVGGSATEGVDFELMAGDVTIADGQSTATVLLEVKDDTLVEFDEEVVLTLTGASHSSVTTSTAPATQTIVDDDDTKISVAAFTQGAENPNVDGVFRVSLDKPAASAVTVTYTYTSSEATSGVGNDYIDSSGSVIIPGGATEAFITVDVLDDTLLESDESINVSLTGFSGGSGSVTLGSVTSADITIDDNETANITVTATDPAALEAGSDPATFRVNLGKVNNTLNDITVTYSVGGSATNGTDYTSLTGTAIIPVGSSGVNVVVTPVDDGTLEPSETVILTLTGNSHAPNASVSSTPATATIHDNDSATLSVTASGSPSETGPTVGVFTVSLDAPSSTATVFNYTLSGSATSGADFVPVVGSATIPALASSVNITITPIDDVTVEGNEDVVLTLGNMSSGDANITVSPTPATLTIADNDSANVSVSVSDSVAAEPGNDGQFLISLSSVSSEDVVVYYSASGSATEGDDYASLTGSVTIPAGQSTAIVDINVTNDSLVEGTENVTLTIDSLDTNGVPSITVGSASAALAIEDDEIGVSISANDPNAAEPANNGQFTVTLTQASSVDTTIAYSIGGTAANGVDYTSLTGQVIVPQGQTTAVIDVAVINDSLLELTENVELTLTSIVAGDPDTYLDGQTVASVDITDNDAGGLITIFSNDSLGKEAALPDNGEFTVDLGVINSTGSDVVVTYSLSGDATPGDDYVANPLGLVTIPNGERYATIAILVNDDNTVELTESVVAEIIGVSSAVSLGYSSSPSTINIVDNDTAEVSITATNGAEGGADGVFTVQLSKPSSQNTLVTYTLAGGDATNPDDYTSPAASGTLMFTAGQTSMDITVDIEDDALLEGNETVSYSLSGIDANGASVTLSASPVATVTITDNDTATLSLIATDNLGSEPGANDARFSVSLTSASASDTTVTYSIGGSATNGADYTSLTGTVVIPATTLSAVIPIDVLDDTLLEGPQDVVLAITGFTGASGITADLTPDTATITDDESATVTITANLPNATEDPIVNGQFTITLDKPNNSGGDLLVTYSIADSATPGSDYTALAAGSTGVAVIANGDSTAVIDVLVLQDSEVEGPETIELTLQSTNLPLANVSVDPVPGIVTITDGDAAMVSIAAVEQAGEPSSNGVFLVKMSAASATDTVVYYSVSGSASNGVDYTSLTGSVTIAAGQFNTTIDVTVSDDLLLEGDETVELTLTSVAGDPDISLSTVAGETEATVTIDDNDVAEVSISSATASGDESVTDRVFTVTLDKVNNTGADITVTLATGGTASDPGDYSGIPSTVVIANGQSEAMVTATVVDDSTVEPDEDIQVSITGVTAANSSATVTVGASDSADSSILDEDTAEVTITATDGAEGGSDGLFTVTLSNPSQSATVVTFTIAGGSADIGADYTAPPATETVVFAPGSQTATINVDISDDALLESDESVIGVLSGVTGDPDITLAAPNTTITYSLSLEPDDYADGDLLDTVDPNVTLSNNGSGPVYATTQPFVSTGARGFDTNATNGGSDIWGTLRMDFNVPVYSVSIDVIADDSNDGGFLQAFDSSNNRLDWDSVSGVDGDASTGMGPGGAIRTLTVTSLTPIAYATVASGASQYDNLRYVSTVPALGATVTIADNDTATATVSEVAPASADESVAARQFLVTLDKVNNTGSDITVTYSLAGTATNGSDYSVTPTGSVVIADGQSTAVIDVTVSDDVLLESDETVQVTLTGASNAAVTATDSAELTIEDNETTTVTITNSDGAATETSGDNGRFTVNLGTVNNTLAPIVVNFTLTGTAGAGDYTASPTAAVTIGIGQSTGTIDIVPIDDALLESTESVVAVLTGTSNPAATVNSSPSTVTIVDNDTATVQISGDATVTEPDDHVFVVTMDKVNNTGGNITVTYSTGGDASVGSDYASLSGVAVIANGESTATISIDVQDDNTLEPTETLTISLGATSNHPAVTGGSVTLSSLVIKDNDTSYVSITKTADGVDATTPTNGQFTVSLTNPSSTHTTVTFSVAGDATPGLDYAALGSTVVIPAGTLSKVIDVTVSDDVTVEDTEEVILTLTGVSGDADVSLSTVSGETAATVSITDTDNAAVSVSAVNAVESESVGSFVFSISLSQQSDSQTVVYYSLGGNAANPADYTVSPAGSVTFAPGVTNKDVTISVVNDTFLESDEVVDITLTTVTGDVDITLGSPTTATVTIDDDDTATVVISASDANAAESTGTPNPGVFKVDLGKVNMTGADITVTLGTASGSATEGVDYTSLPTTVVIGNNQQSAFVTVSVSDDLVVEPSEQAILGLSSASHTSVGVSSALATVTITDNDSASVSIAATSDAVEDTQNGKFTVSLDKVSSTPTIVTYTISGDATPGSDYTPLTGTVTIPSLSFSQDIDVTVLPDITLEDDERVIVDLTTVSGASAIALSTVAGETNATVTITDTDEATLSVAEVASSIAENTAGTSVVFKVTLSAPSDSLTSFFYSFSGTATQGAGNDFTDPQSGFATIGVGDTTADITLTINDDALLESPETIVLTLNPVLNSGDVDITVTAPSDAATVTITDNETATASITADSSATEGGSDGVFTVTLDKVNNTADTITVTYSVTGGDASLGSDYSSPAGTGTVEIAPGASTAAIALTAVNDNTVENDETVIVSLEPSTSNAAVTGSGSATGTIVDNDTAFVTISGTNNGNEAGPTNGKFTVTLDKPVSTGTMVTYSVGGTATPGADYTSLSGTVFIPMNTTVATIDVTVSDDVLLESTESLQLTLTGTSNADVSLSATSIASIDIVDNETATINLVANDPAATETSGNPGQFSVNLGKVNNTQNPISVTYTLLGGVDSATNGVDYTSLTGVAVIPVGQQVATIDINPSDDTTVEANELVRVQLTGHDGGASISHNTTPATVTITDNDSATLSIAGTQNGSESPLTNGQFTVSLTQRSSTDTTVTYTISGGNATQGSDFNTLAGTAVIPAGSLSQTIDVVVINDTLLEGNETLQLKVSGFTGDPDITASTAAATITISSEDTAVATVAPSTASALESVASRNFVVTLSKVNNTGGNILVGYTLTGSATAGADYSPASTSGSVTIANGFSVGTIALTVSDDLLLEADEKIQVSLTGSSFASVTASDTSELTIVDNETATVSVFANDATAKEGLPTNNGQFKVQLDKVNNTGANITVNYILTGSATNGIDYSTLNGTAIIPIGQSTADISIFPIDDSLVEPTESVTVTLTSVSNSDVTIGTASDVVTIEDNDTSTVKIVANDAAAAEGTPVDNGQFTVSLTKPSSVDTTVTYTVGGNASIGSDYTMPTGTLVIPASATVGTIDVTVLDDGDLEADEEVRVTLTGVSGNTGVTLSTLTADKNATVTIVDDESATVTITAINGTVAEPAGSPSPMVAEYRVSLSQASYSDTTVTYSIGGNAEAADYGISPTGTVVIDAGDTEAFISLSIQPDNFLEGDETVVVTLSPTVTGDSDISVGSPDGATVTITDDESATAFILNWDDGTEPATPGYFLVVLADPGFNFGIPNQSGGDIVLTYSIPGGSATEGTDYTSLTGSVTIANGFDRAYITIDVSNDTTLEPDETVIVSLTGSDNAAVTLDSADATVTIFDEDSAVLSIVANDPNAEEPADNGQFTVSLTQPSSTDTIVTYSIGGNAVGGTVSPADYQQLTGTVVIPAGSLSETIDVNVIDDDILDVDKRVILAITGFTGDSDISFAASATYTESGDAGELPGTSQDASSVSGLTQIDGVLTGGVDADVYKIYIANPATFSATTAGGALFDTQLFLFKLDGTGVTHNDDLSTSLRSTISGVNVPGPGYYYLAISGYNYDPISGGDLIWNNTPFVSERAPDGPGAAGVVDGWSGGGAAGSYSIFIAGAGVSPAATVTIFDEDVTSVTLAVSDATADEAGDSGQFTVTLGNPSSTETVLSYSMSGVATNGTDYTSLTGLVTIPSGSTVGTINIDGIADGDFEGPESVVLTLGTRVKGDVDIAVPAQSATLTIVDSDSPTVSVTASQASASEAGPVHGEFTVDLGTPNLTGSDITVTLGVAGSATAGSDYTALPATVVIPNTAQSVVVPVTVSNDLLLESTENVLVSITGTNNTLVNVDASEATVDIADNDVATATIDASPSSIVEGTSALYTVDLGKVNNTGVDITLTLSSPTGSAAASDYSGFPSQVIIPVGQQTATFSVLATDDATIEASETVNVSLTGSSNAAVTAVDSASLEITDNDSGSLYIVRKRDGREGAALPGAFTVYLTSPSSSATTVVYQIAGTATQGDDYSTPAGSVALSAGVTSLDISIPVVDDTLVEGDETVVIELTTITSGDPQITIDGSQDTATITIFDNDTLTATVAGRHIFYNNSAFDGNGSAVSAADNAAIDTSKVALLPGSTATFANYTGYSRGINGIAVDIMNLATIPQANLSDIGNFFQFRVGNDNNPAGWANAPTPSSVTVLPGAGASGSDRVLLTWADNQIVLKWLQVIVKSGAATGLATRDVHYWGNSPGETGNAADTFVTAADAGKVIANFTTSSVSPVTDANDLNKDKFVTAADVGVVIGNFTNATTLLLINAPGTGLPAEGEGPDNGFPVGGVAPTGMGNPVNPQLFRPRTIGVRMADSIMGPFLPGPVESQGVSSAGKESPVEAEASDFASLADQVFSEDELENPWDFI